jgi:hypothetical protein
MPAGRYALTMERAAAMSHKLDPQTGERLRFGKTKSQRRGSKAAANPRTWRGAQSTNPKTATFPGEAQLTPILNEHLAHSFRSDMKRGPRGANRYGTRRQNKRFPSAMAQPPVITHYTKPRKLIKAHSTAGVAEFSIDPETREVFRSHPSGGKGWPSGTVEEIIARGSYFGDPWWQE